MSDFIQKLNGIVLGIGNAENTGSSVGRGSHKQDRYANTNTDREAPFQKRASHTNTNTNTNTSKKSKRRQRLRAVWKSSAGGAVTMVGTRYLY